MNTHNIGFRGEIRKILILFSVLSRTIKGFLLKVWSSPYLNITTHAPDFWHPSIQMKAEDLASPWERPVKFGTSFTVLQTLVFGFTTEIITSKGDNSLENSNSRHTNFSSMRLQATQACFYLLGTSSKQYVSSSAGQAEMSTGGEGKGKRNITQAGKPASWSHLFIRKIKFNWNHAHLSNKTTTCGVICIIFQALFPCNVKKEKEKNEHHNFLHLNLRQYSTS